MTSLVVAEHDNHTLSEATARTATAALALGADIDVLVAGQDCAAVAQAAAALAGVRRVLLADAAAYRDRSPEALAALIVREASAYQALLAPATATGKSAMPRVAALLDVMQLSDVIEILTPDTFRRPVYAGNAIETLRSGDPVKVLTVRTTAFAPAAGGNTAPVQPLAPGETFTRSRLVSESAGRSDRPELSSARIVVSGGRAFGSADSFDALLGPLADKLGAAIGASRAAVDAGFAANDLQVGQTGQVVAPELYIACGISGAIQHIAGMKDSKVIVAINSDPDAPIFQIADYGLAGDIFTLLPELTAKL